MIVRARQQVFLALFYPFYTLMPLAFWAMPVSAAIVADGDVPAITTGIDMSAQGCRSAPGDGTQGLLLVDGKRGSLRIYVANDIGYFPCRLHCTKTLSSGLWGSFSGR